jgi:HK97 family phage prohead protease
MAGDIAHIVGYGAVFGKLSRKLGGFVERVDNRAFGTSQGAGWPGVICRYNHSDDWLLGTIQGGTLDLRVDNQGLYYDAITPETRAGQDVILLCRRGDIVSSSFAFRVPDGGDDWGLTPYGYPLRTLLEADLVDVAPVNTPAYPDATAAARSIDGAVESLARYADADPAEVRSLLDENQAMKFFKRTGRPTAAQPVSQDTPEAPESEEVLMTAEELRAAWYEAEVRAKYDEAALKKMSKTGGTMPNAKGEPSYPIGDQEDLHNAIHAIGRGKADHDKIKAHIKDRAKALGLTSQLPQSWHAEDNSLASTGVQAGDVMAPADDKDDNVELNAAAPADEKFEEFCIRLAGILQDDDSEARGKLPPALQAAIDKKAGKKPDSEDDDSEDDDDDAKDKPAKPAKADKRSDEDQERWERLMRLRFDPLDD